MIAAGPGQTLETFVDHLKTMHPDARRNPPARLGAGSAFHEHPRDASFESHQDISWDSSKSSLAPTPSASAQRTLEVAPASDVVKSFLADHGLGPDFAPILQVIGIFDHARMRALGRLSEHSLDRLERELSERGLDFTACLLVRDGLQRFAEVE